MEIDVTGPCGYQTCKRVNSFPVITPVTKRGRLMVFPKMQETPLTGGVGRQQWHGDSGFSSQNFSLLKTLFWDHSFYGWTQQSKSYFQAFNGKTHSSL